MIMSRLIVYNAMLTTATITPPMIAAALSNMVTPW
jgi:hypothetical protein